MSIQLNKIEKERYEKVIAEELAKNKNVSQLRIVWEIYKYPDMRCHTMSEMHRMVNNILRRKYDIQRNPTRI